MTALRATGGQWSGAERDISEHDGFSSTSFDGTGIEGS